MEVLNKSFGILNYGINSREVIGYKLVVEVDQGISDYYRSLIPRYKDVQEPMWPAHISVVRKEIPINLEAWGKYQGKQIEFYYSPIINEGTVYYWLNVFSKELEEVRLELGLPVSSIYTLPPEGFVKCFHLTIGNKKAWL